MSDKLPTKRGQINNILELGVSVIVFIKKNGDSRCMLATRDISVPRLVGRSLSAELYGMDKRNEKHDGVISVIDLEIHQVRSFRLDKLVYLKDMGCVGTGEELKIIKSKFEAFKESYKAENDKKVNKKDSMESLDGDITDVQVLNKIGSITLDI